VVESSGDEADRQDIVARLAAIERRQPKIDARAAETALAEHFAMLGLPCPPVRWAVDPEEAWRRIFAIAEAAAIAANAAAGRAAMLTAAWSAVRSLAPSLVRTAAQMAAGTAALPAPWLATEEAAWAVAESAMLATAGHETESLGVWSAVRSALWSPPWSAAVRSAAGDSTIWRPFAKAAEAGLWRLWIAEREIVALPRPSILVEAGRLHSAVGPAVSWPNGARYWFWRGVSVPEHVIALPRLISVTGIDAQTNAEIRRVMIERYRAGEEIHGAAAYLLDAGAERLDHDGLFGTLWRREMPGDEPILMLEVVNRTPEPDGSCKHYWLRVHPELRPLPPGHWPEEKKRAWLRRRRPQARTARAAAASIHGRRAKDYRPRIET
jgi:hypothetical protein